MSIGASGHGWHGTSSDRALGMDGLMNEIERCWSRAHLETWSWILSAIGHASIPDKSYRHCDVGYLGFALEKVLFVV